jgi:sulfate permease, SulP family
VPGLLAVRPEGRLFFANARRVVDRIAAIAGDQRPRRGWCCWTSAPSTTSRSPRWSGWPTSQTASTGRALWVAAPSQRPLEMLRRAAELLGRSDLQADTGRLGVRVFPSLEDAVAAYEEQIEPDRPSA